MKTIIHKNESLTISPLMKVFRQGTSYVASTFLIYYSPADAELVSLLIVWLYPC